MMYRIGIIGTENTHAMAFAKYYNLPDAVTGKMHHDNIRVTAVMGDDESTSAIVKETGVEFVAHNVEDFFDRVDAIAITNRKGSLHSQYALPFIDKGIPVFIDKPLTSNLAEAKELMARVAASGCKAMGGSGCKYPEEIKEIRQFVTELRQKNEFMGASMNFTVMLDSPYDGIYFYAPHLVEMCLAAFGYDPKAVHAVRTGDCMIVIVQYEKDAISLHFNRSSKEYSCLIYGANENRTFNIDISNIYAQEAEYFAEMIQGKSPAFSEDVLLMPVVMIDAIEKSLSTGSCVAL